MADRSPIILTDPAWPCEAFADVKFLFNKKESGGWATFMEVPVTEEDRMHLGAAGLERTLVQGTSALQVLNI